MDPEKFRPQLTEVPRPRPQAERYLSYLAEEGFRPELEDSPPDEAALVTFKAEGRRYAVLVDEDDPACFHLALSYRTDDHEAELPRLLEVANAINAGWKGPKATVDEEDESVTFSTEIYLEDAERFGSAMMRAISALGGASDAFFRRLDEAPDE